MSNLIGPFNSLTTLQKSLVVAIVSIVLFVGSAGASYSLSTKGVVLPSVGDTKSNTPTVAGGITEDPSEPKTEECPLNGSFRTKKSKVAWEPRLPLAVMIENHQDARPQSGLSSADVVYEVVAEGGITRFMALFYCNSLGDIQVGPVRSARTYFLDWQGEYNNPLYAHVGGANTPGPADALGQIIKYGIKDLNQFSIGFPTFWRDYQRLGHSVATEHTMYSSTQKLWTVGEKRGWVAKDEDTGKLWSAGFIPWKFTKDEIKGGSNTNIDVSFWDGYGDYKVTWAYDGGCNCYKRTNGGKSHVDLNTNQQLAAKVVVVQFERESHANDGYEGNAHLLYGTTGIGKALIIQGGKVTEGKWTKTSRLTRTKYTDSSGTEVQFNRGLIWIQTVPEGSSVKF